jgi:hypothetical protein
MNGMNAGEVAAKGGRQASMRRKADFFLATN